MEVDAAFLERFLAREQRRLVTGLLPAAEREPVRLPKRGRVPARAAFELGLRPIASGAADGPRWLPRADLYRLLDSPFAPNVRPMGRPPTNVRIYLRLLRIARRHGHEALLPAPPLAMTDRVARQDRRRAEFAQGGTDDVLLALADRHYGLEGETCNASATQRARALRTFASTLPKFERRASSRRLFPLSDAKIARRQRRARAIADAMAGMSAKVAAYRRTVSAERDAAQRSSPL